MQLDTTVHKGSAGKPVVIFVHGLGVDKGFWTDPVNTRVLGKSIPMKVFAARKPRPRSIHSKRGLTAGMLPETTENLWIKVINSGFNAVCWSQKRPAGPISVAVRELGYILDYVKETFPGRPVAVIGHSRGGLVARKLMEKDFPEIRALITITTPHKGSSLSRLGSYLSPLAPALKRMLPKDSHFIAADIMRKMHDLLEGQALRELLPGSDFFATLKDPHRDDITYMSFGGTVTTLLTIYKWKNEGDRICPVPLLTVPDSLSTILPAKILPDELTPGRGDFMVTAESSVLPWAKRHYNIPANHISITWNRKLKNIVMEVLEGI